MLKTNKLVPFVVLVCAAGLASGFTLGFSGCKSDDKGGSSSDGGSGSGSQQDGGNPTAGSGSNAGHGGSSGGSAGSSGSGASGSSGGSTAGASGSSAGNGGAGGDVADGSVPDASESADGSTANNDGGSSGPCTHTFCEDFETGVLDTNVWKIANWYGSMCTPDIEGTQVRPDGKSTKAAHFQLKAMDDDGRFCGISTTPPGDALQDHLFGRAWFRTSFDKMRGHTFFFSTGAPTQQKQSPADNELEIAQTNGVWQLTAHGDNEIVAAYGTIPQNKWFCLEWEMVSSTGDMTVYVDNDQVAMFHAPNAANWTKFKEMRFGVGAYGGNNFTTPADVWYDDIVLDGTARIGCN